jgi:hypothetical protein
MVEHPRTDRASRYRRRGGRKEMKQPTCRTTTTRPYFRALGNGFALLLAGLAGWLFLLLDDPLF